MKAKKGFYFPYGLHMPDKKYLSAGKSIERMPLPPAVSISLSQAIGKPSLPVVSPGDKVITGQLIAKADGFVSSDIFSSVSGEVTGIESRETEVGTSETFIDIKCSGGEDKILLPPMPGLTQSEIIARVQGAGIVGLGGASFPTHVKLSPKNPVDTLILNGAECEPYLTCDYRLMIERADEIADGARLTAKALGVSRILIGIESNKPDAVAAFEKYDDIQPVILKKQYPMGSEKHLIYVCTKRKVALGKLPADVGCIVENVATAYAIYEAVRHNKPLYERVVTVSGLAVKEPKNLIVPLGTDFESVALACGGVTDRLAKIVRGGPMTGSALVKNKGYTRKATGGIVYMDDTEADAFDPTPCLSCGKCADVCPMKLMPMQTSLYCEAKDYARAARLGGVKYCIECGSCSYICPAKRPLIQNIRRAKQELKRGAPAVAPVDKRADKPNDISSVTKNENKGGV